MVLGHGEGHHTSVDVAWHCRPVVNTEEGAFCNWKYYIRSKKAVEKEVIPDD